MGKSKSKQNTKYRDYLATGGGGNYGIIYEDMLKHPVYKSLSLGAKQFYTICRIQARSKASTQCLYKHGVETGVEYDTSCFVLTSKHLEQYGYRRNHSTRYFNELIEKGFIERVENNAHRHKVNVYRFSRKWLLNSS